MLCVHASGFKHAASASASTYTFGLRRHQSMCADEAAAGRAWWETQHAEALHIGLAAGGPPYIKDARLRRSPPALGASGAVSAIVIADVLLNPWRMVRCRANNSSTYSCLWCCEMS